MIPDRIVNEPIVALQSPPLGLCDAAHTSRDPKTGEALSRYWCNRPYGHGGTIHEYDPSDPLLNTADNPEWPPWVRRSSDPRGVFWAYCWPVEKTA